MYFLTMRLIPSLTGLELEEGNHTPVSIMILTRCLRGASWRLTRNRARSRSACVTMGTSSEIFKEDFLFIFLRLSYGDNMDFFWPFGMRDDHYRKTAQIHGNPALFFVVKPSIPKCKGGPGENLMSIGKVNAVFLDISLQDDGFFTVISLCFIVGPVG